MVKIGIDIDGTVTDFPEFFKILCGAVLDGGGEVHVITYRMPMEGELESLEKYLEAEGVRYTKIHMTAENVQDYDWKSQLVAQLGLDVMIEDSPEVLSRMPEGVHRMWLCDIFDLGRCILALKE